MSFIQSCLIRKKNKRLIEKLNNLGYVYPDKFHKIGTNLLTLPCRHWREGRVISFTNENLSLVRRLRSGQHTFHHPIDCGTNEELFLAIAAIRDDGDVNQWFVNADGNFKMYCNDTMEDDWDETYRKATVEELIEHFTD